MGFTKDFYHEEICALGGEPMYDDGGSALSHYRQVLKEAKQTIKFKYSIGDKVAHKGKQGTIIARQYFEFQFPMTEYSVRFEDENYWAKEGELTEAR